MNRIVYTFNVRKVSLLKLYQKGLKNLSEYILERKKASVSLYNDTHLEYQVSSDEQADRSYNDVVYLFFSKTY